MRREDPLGRQRPEYKRNVAVEREGTRKPVQPKTVTDGGRDPSPAGAHRDPYMPRSADLIGYDPKLRPAIAAAEALERRNAAAKRRRKR